MTKTSTITNDKRGSALAEIVLGTHNQKKGIELDELLRPHGLVVRTLRDFDDPIHVVEDGDTFGENAAKKACQQAEHVNCWVIGEDSGLCVDALDGAPGIYSARFSGPDANDESNNQQLLEKLSGTPKEKRGAHYHCHVVVSDPMGNVRAEASSQCHGRILVKPLGTSGFGYDPLFFIPEYHQTFAQLGSTVKAVLSHRSRAMRQILPELPRLLADAG